MRVFHSGEGSGRIGIPSFPQRRMLQLKIEIIISAVVVNQISNALRYHILGIYLPSMTTTHVIQYQAIIHNGEYPEDRSGFRTRSTPRTYKWLTEPGTSRVFLELLGHWTLASNPGAEPPPPPPPPLHAYNNQCSVGTATWGTF